MSLNTIKETALYRSLLKGTTILGLPLSWFALNCVIPLLIWFLVFNVVALFVANTLFIFLFFLGRKLYSKDPNFLDVWEVAFKIEGASLLDKKRDQTYYP